MAKSSRLNGLLWSWQSFGESTILDLRFPSNFQVKEKIYWNKSRNKEIILELKMSKSACLKFTYGHPGIVYGVALQGTLLP